MVKKLVKVVGVLIFVLVTIALMRSTPGNSAESGFGGVWAGIDNTPTRGTQLVISSFSGNYSIIYTENCPTCERLGDSIQDIYCDGQTLRFTRVFYDHIHGYAGNEYIDRQEKEEHQFSNIRLSDDGQIMSGVLNAYHQNLGHVATNVPCTWTRLQ